MKPGAPGDALVMESQIRIVFNEEYSHCHSVMRSGEPVLGGQMWPAPPARPAINPVSESK